MSRILLFIVVFNPLSIHLRPVTTTIEQVNSKLRTKKAEPGKRWKASYLDEHCEGSETDACWNIFEEEEATECSEEMSDEAEHEEEEGHAVLLVEGGGEEADDKDGRVEEGEEQGSEASEESTTLPIEAATCREHKELFGGEGQLQHQRENPPNNCRYSQELQVALCRMSRRCLRPW